MERMTTKPMRPRGRPVDPDARAERRAQILAAAQRCFVRKGFHATTTAELSAEAEISVAGLYQYFPSKEALVLALIEVDLQQGILLVDQIVEGGDFLEGLERAANIILEHEALRDFGLLRLEILAEASRSPAVSEMVVSSDQRFIAALVRAISLAQAKGQLRNDIDSYEAAIAILCLSDGFYGRLAMPPATRGPFVKACATVLRQALSPR
jgi:TetR/AcrR family transcriptional repressor of uid operon